ncbi:DDB1- and CUL4-associated factor 12 [Mortierella alpina]|nr:DDB1- and CUL4-associated factor 12 [Mortierella alpina]
MDWFTGETLAERRRKAVKTTATSSLSKSAAAYGKSFMMMGQAMGFGAYSCPSNPSSAASSVPREITNSHLSVAQLGGSGRRMSTPSMPSPPQMPYCDSRASNSSASCRSSSLAPRPSSALSNPRTWIASSPALGSSRTSSDESNGYYNVGQRQSDAGSTGSPTAIYGYRPSDQTVDLVSSRIPPLLAEREYKVEGLDKIFAVTWLSSEEVLLGTKCNKLIVLNTRTGKQLTLGRLEECLLSSVASELSRIEGIAAAGSSGNSSPLSNKSPTTGSPNTRVYGATHLSNNNRQGSVSSGITNSLERGLRFFNSGRRSSTPSFTMVGNALAGNRPYATGNYTTAMATATATLGTANRSPAPTTNTAALGSRSPSASPNSSTGAMHAMAAASTSAGVRSISVNPSRTLIAIGASDPFQVTIYSLPEFEAVGVMHGHSDLVFSLTWASDTVLVTGSRDGSMRVWSMDSPVATTLPTVGQPVEVRFHSIAQTEDKTKVRDLSLNRGTGELMTLSTDGYVKLWDRESFSQTSKLKLKYTQETVCLTSNPDANLFAVGSQSHISVIDPRVSSIVHVADSCDEGWGVRSLDFKSHIITSGGGYGRVGFYDLRAQRYLEGFDDKSDRSYHEIGQGWLNRDTAYAGSIIGFQIRNAIYAMEYDSTGTRLFAAGGPLQLGLCGAYAALWS